MLHATRIMFCYEPQHEGAFRGHNMKQQAFSKLQHMQRKAKQRSIDPDWKAGGKILQSFPPEECRNYFVNAGWVRLNA